MLLYINNEQLEKAQNRNIMSNIIFLIKKVKSSMARSIQKTTTVWGVDYQLLAVMIQKYPNGQFLVAVNYN